MLSKIDIEKELGKGINIIPFREENIKENSINLSASEYAWSMTDYEFDIDYKSDDGNQIILSKGEKCVFKRNGKEIIVIPPYSTIIIETEEILGIDGRIGGTYHSKVGIASLGIGHIGTMLGPNFCGHSLVAIHNVSRECIELKVGETFVSVVFNYLNTRFNQSNQTKSGHIEKFSEFGINISRDDREFICHEWKGILESINERMENDPKFKDFKSTLNKRKFKKYKSFINTKNITSSLILIVVAAIFYILAVNLDKGLSKQVWVERYWTILSATIIVPLLSSIIKNLYNN